MKKILILGAGLMQMPIIRKAKELGVYTLVLDYDKDAPGFALADEFDLISTNDVESVLEYSTKNCIDGILTTSDFPVNVVASVAKKMNLPGIDENLAKLCTDKYLQRSFFSSVGIPTPKFICVTVLSELRLVDFFPCIIKPVDSSASRGVKKVSSMNELQIQFPISMQYSKSGRVIVEEFVSAGREFSVEALSQNNCSKIIQITEKLTRGEKNGFFVEDTHIEPARLSELELKQIESAVSDVLEKMHVNNCPTHTELKLNSEGVTIIEIACRLGGDYITSDLVPLSTGVDMLQNLIKISLGQDIDICKTRNSVSTVQFLNQVNYNRCIDFIRSGNESIIRSEVYPYNNQEITSSLERLGYIILNTENMLQMENLLNLLM